MEKKNISCQKFEHLPEEIITELLLRLPVKSLLRFKSVSKSWYALINDEYFIKTHLQHSTKNTGSPFHRISILNRDELISLSVASLFNYDSDDYAISHGFPLTPICVVGCCNGLFCFLSETRRLVLWNPSTKAFKILPDHDYLRLYYVIAVGFGWEEVSDEYKVVVFLCGWDDDYAIAFRTLVYNSKKNSYKTLDHDMHVHVQWNFENEEEIQVGQFVSGKLHWLNTKFAGTEVFGREIVWWDLKSEVFGVTETPPFVMKYDEYDHEHKLGVVGGCVCYVCNNWKSERLLVWMLREKGGKHYCWGKRVKMSLYHVREVEEPRFLIAFVRVKNGETVLLFCGSTLDLRNCEIAGGHIYVESLVMPK